MESAQWLGGAELIPPSITGAVVISAGDLSGCEWLSNQVNPYRSFQSLRADVAIDDSVFIYQGSFGVPEIAAVSRAQRSRRLLGKKQLEPALVMAREAVAIAPANLSSEIALGDAAAATGDRRTAATAWQAAIQVAQYLEPAAQSSYIPDLEARIKRLSNGNI